MKFLCLIVLLLAGCSSHAEAPAGEMPEKDTAIERKEFNRNDRRAENRYEPDTEAEMPKERESK